MSNRSDITAVSWLLVVAATVGLLGVYDTLPEQIPLTRSPLSGEWVSWAPKSVVSVFRIAIMGIGQLGGAAVMQRSAARQGSSHWVHFWTTITLVAAAKTTIEMAQLALLGVPLPPVTAPIFYIAALVPVLVGVAWAGYRLWQHRRTLGRPELDLRERILLGLSLAAWLSGAIVPLLVGGAR